MKKLLLIAMVGALAGSAFAEEDEISAERFWTPLQINLVSPLGLPWADRDVYGLRVNLLYGHSIDVAGLDFGLVGATRGSMRGLQMNVYNHVEGVFRGVQFGPFANYTVKTNYGIQLAGLLNWGLDDGAGAQIALLNFNGAYTGLQLGLVNWDSGLDCGLSIGGFNIADTDFTGCAIAPLNICHGNFRGFQLGVFNLVAGHSEGFQLGVFNASEDHTGAQLGLFNLNCNGHIPVMLLFNVNFR
mgnify:CR=1 FL=1